MTYDAPAIELRLPVNDPLIIGNVAPGTNFRPASPTWSPTDDGEVGSTGRGR